jgi:hypothetical protein
MAVFGSMKKVASPRGARNRPTRGCAEVGEPLGHSRNRFVGFEVQIALDEKAEFAAHSGKLKQTHVAEFVFTHA